MHAHDNPPDYLAGSTGDENTSDASEDPTNMNTTSCASTRDARCSGRQLRGRSSSSFLSTRRALGWASYSPNTEIRGMLDAELNSTWASRVRNRRATMRRLGESITGRQRAPVNTRARARAGEREIYYLCLFLFLYYKIAIFIYIATFTLLFDHNGLVYIVRFIRVLYN